MSTLEESTVVHEPAEAFVKDTNIWAFMQEYGIDDYEELIERTTTEVDGVPESGLDWFWDELVAYLDIEFYTPYDDVRDASDGPQFTEWYTGGELNIAHNVLDRHVRADQTARDQTALIWEGEDGTVEEVAYQRLYAEANQVANFLEESGVTAGDTVALYMPMVPEVLSILYGVFKAGAVAVPIFSGFGVDAAATRIADAEPTVLFTGDGFYRRGEPIRLKQTADDAIDQAGHVEQTVVVDRLGDVADETAPWTDRDRTWEAAVTTQSQEYETTPVPSHHPAMLLYSSGTTGMPKGIVQTHAGAQIQCAKEVYFGFDLRPSDRFFWVADIGWMMGPWTFIGTNTFGATAVMYEGAPDHPDPGRYWDLIERHQVTQFGISPTAIRALREHGTEWVDKHDLSSLRLLGSTGEPWDPDSWQWFYDHVGGGKTPIINISGGTEICGCFLMPMPIQSLKPGTLGGPGLGMDIDIVDRDGQSIVDTTKRGYLVARSSCPSMTNSLWSGDTRYLEEYWSTWEDLWDHGDWAQRDEDGLWYLHGRADEALNVAGRKVGPAEIEAAAVEHPAVSQAAAIGVPDDVTGTAVVVYAVPEPGVDTEGLEAAITNQVGDRHGKPFRPSEVHVIDELPKTQSGKIVRRAIESAHAGEEPGDRSSIKNPAVLERIPPSE